MGASIQCHICSDHEHGFSRFSRLKMWGWAEMMSWCYGCGCQPTLMTTSLTFSIYWKCLCWITLRRCCGWAHGCTLHTVSHHWQQAQMFLRTHRVRVSRKDAMMLWLRLPTTPDRIPVSEYILTVFGHIDMLLMSSWVHPYSVAPLTMSLDFSKKLKGEGERKWCHDVMVEAASQHCWLQIWLSH